MSNKELEELRIKEQQLLDAYDNAYLCGSADLLVIWDEWCAAYEARILAEKEMTNDLHK